MGRRRKAWLQNGDGIRFKGGEQLEGFWVRWHEYSPSGRHTPSRKFTRKTDARAFVRRYNAQVELGLLGHVVKVTLEEASTQFFMGKATLARKSRSDYVTAIAMLGEVVSDRFVCDIGGMDIDRFIASRTSREATTAKHLRSLRTFFNWAVKHRMANLNPVREASTRPPDIHIRERPMVSAEQLAAIIEHVGTEHRRLAVWLAMTTGLDRGVIESLCTYQIDRDTKHIIVVRPKTRRQKNPKRLQIPIHHQLAPSLFALLNESEPHRPLFVGLSRQADHKDWWKLATKAAGCPSLYFRDLRAQFSSLAQKQGMTLPQVQKQLGHSDPALTANFYTMPDPHIRQQVDAMPLPGFESIAAGSTG